jgi:hypothetical protein
MEIMIREGSRSVPIHGNADLPKSVLNDNEGLGLVGFSAILIAAWY